MSPEERQLLQGLFDRMRSSAGATRDAEAEKMIADGVQQQPYAPYLLAQTVIVQDQALQAANQRLQEMEQELQQARSSSQSSGSGGFLSGLFGGGQRQEPPPPPSQSVWNRGGSAPGPGYGQGYAPQGYPPQGGYAQGGYAPPPPPQGGPWGGGMAGGGGGGFLQGALGTAAGVAGGVLLADSIKGLFSGGAHNNAFGIADGVPGIDSNTIMGPEVVNNYYGDGGGRTAADWQSDAAQDAGDYGGGDRTSADWQQDADQDMDDMQDDDDGFA